MLLELRIEGLLLIDRSELRPGPGLNVITGETGAGKTVLAHAIDLLLGGRAKPGIVRPGAGEAYVEGVFELPTELLASAEIAELRDRLGNAEGDGEVTLARRVSAEGRTRAYVNGRSASAADLRELGGRLVAFFGQHEHRRLTMGSAQLGLVDDFCGPRHLALRDRVGSSYARARELGRELDGLRGRSATRDRDLDLLRFEIDEIDALAPSEEEESALTAERARLAGADGLRTAAAGAAEALVPEGADGSGAAMLIAGAERLADGVAGADPVLDALAARLRSLQLEAEDLGGEMRRHLDGLEADPARLREVEERLDGYERLKRKHGGSVAAVLEHASRCRSERDRLEGAEVAVERAEAQLVEVRTELERLCGELSSGRRAAAPELAERVRSELAALAMDGASFAVEIEPREQPGPGGSEGVELMLASNPGVAAAPVRDAASGGELSRVMLALMTVAGAGRSDVTLVFDEVDAGVGGQTARAVGQRLRALASERQVLCITHLPQVAALAQRHFRIEKSAGELTRASVEALDDGAVVEELCRMLGAESSDTGARRHAEELLAAA